ncbi:MAG: hypothetical protein ACQEWV_22295 [Bacillota bacterium]
MKTSISLIIVIILMQMTTLVNVTIFNGEWDGIVLMFSSLLFIFATAVFGISMQRNK